MSSALLFTAALLAMQAPGAVKPSPKPAPMSVRVEAAASGGQAVQDWAKELSSALEARKDDFRLATAKEKPEFVVRLDSVRPGANGGSPLLSGALLLGAANRPFTYSFANVHTEAEKLARNLRSVADQMKATGK